jgi:hypothetical protein
MGEGALMVEELKKIKPLLEKIKTLKQKGLTGFGIMASYIHRRVQPLRARETYSFEYTSTEDPSWLVPLEELTEDEVLQRLRTELMNMMLQIRLLL